MLSLSGDPFDNSAGFQFPPPEGLSSPTNRTCSSRRPSFRRPSGRKPPVSTFPATTTRCGPRSLNRLNGSPAYRKLFGKVFPEVKAGAPITFDMFGKAIAEFEFTLTFANAPIDRFARGERDAYDGG